MFRTQCVCDITFIEITSKFSTFKTYPYDDAPLKKLWTKDSIKQWKRSLDQPTGAFDSSQIKAEEIKRTILPADNCKSCKNDRARMLSSMDGLIVSLKDRFATLGGSSRGVSIGLKPNDEDAEIEYFDVVHIVLKPTKVFAVPLKPNRFEDVHVDKIGGIRLPALASYVIEDPSYGGEVCLLSSWYGRHATPPSHVLYLDKTGVVI